MGGVGLSDIGHDRVNDFDVCGGKWQFGQFRDGDPANFITGEGLRFAGKMGAVVDLKRHFKVTIGMIDRDQMLANFDLDRQLFKNLTLNAGFRRFARFDFAAGKFPQPAEQPLRRTPIDQDPIAAIVPNDGHADVFMGNRGFRFAHGNIGRKT